MKVPKQVEVSICDFCKESEAAYSSCRGCGKDICYDCRKTEAVEYTHAINFSGRGDGIYCHECDDALKADPLHRAYARIASLKRESEDFRKRSDEAEAALKRIQEQQAVTA